MAHSRESSTLSQRLVALTTWIPGGARVLDVGTDHALLPIYLIQQDLATSVIAADVALGPYETAQQNVAAAGLQSRIDVRFGSGLSVVTPGEVDTVVVAGMGGATIADVLTGHKEVCASIANFVLQPMNAQARLRETLMELNLLIVNERMIEEAGHIYQLLVAHKATQAAVSAQYQPYAEVGQVWLAMEFGPKNLLRSNDQFVRKSILQTREHFASILAQLPESPGEATLHRKEQLHEQLRQMEQWLNAAEM